MTPASLKLVEWQFFPSTTVFSFPRGGKMPAARRDPGRSLPVLLLVRVRVSI
jgi:hypothetical protein